VGKDQNMRVAEPRYVRRVCATHCRHYDTPVAGENAGFPPSAQLLLEKEEPAKARGQAVRAFVSK